MTRSIKILISLLIALAIPAIGHAAFDFSTPASQSQNSLSPDKTLESIVNSSLPQTNSDTNASGGPTTNGTSNSGNNDSKKNYDQKAGTGDSTYSSGQGGERSKDACGWSDPGACIAWFFYSTLDSIGNAILWLFSWILWLGGTMFNLSIVVFVIHMKSIIENIPEISVVWRTLRDLANMFFIFILLVTAIETILGKGNYKQTLRSVVLIALFINFSFFITGALIDVSNILALQFYKGFARSECVDGCVSETVMKELRLGTIYDTDTTPNTSDVRNANSKSMTLSSEDGIGAFFIIVLAGSMMMVILGGIFLASAIMIFFRFIELITVLMLSPIAFAASILPGTKKYYNQWWEKLTKQVIFAPVYFMFLWINMKIITSGMLNKIMGTSDGKFTSGFLGDPKMLFGLLANFIIINIMLGYSLKLANELGASGADVAASAAGKLKGIVGRNTVGRISSRVANSQAMKGFVSKSPTIGRFVQKGLGAGASYSFGDKSVKGGYEQRKKDSIKEKESIQKNLGADPIALSKANANFDKADTAHKNAEEAHKKATEQAEKDIAPTFKAQKDEHSEKEKQLNKENDFVNEKVLAAEDRVRNAKNDQERTDAQNEVSNGKIKLAELKEQRTKLNAEKQRVANEEKSAIESATRETKEKLELATREKKTAEDHKNSLNKIETKRKEEFAKATERDYGASKIASVGAGITGFKGKVARTPFKIAGALMNTATMQRDRALEAEALRKAAKKKPKKEQLADLAKEVAKEDEEADKGAEKDTKPEEKDKPKEEKK